VTPIASLAPFVRAAKRAREAPRCEVCGAPIGDQHRHVVDRPQRKLLCACTACALAFEGEQPARFRSVPEATRAVALTEEEFEHLGIPIALAFFFRPSSLGRWVAVFPSVAGATEAELSDEAEALLERCAIADDVEALLVHRPRAKAVRSFVVPVALGYELAATLRRTWRGIDGGDEAKLAIEGVFSRLEAAA
jgi:hypothetical protein